MYISYFFDSSMLFINTKHAAFFCLKKEEILVVDNLCTKIPDVYGGLVQMSAVNIIMSDLCFVIWQFEKTSQRNR